MDGLIINILEQGFIFAIMAIGVYITYRILDFPDLSVDGTFALGAAVTAAALVKGVNPFISLILAFISGIMAGGITGILHVKLKITNLLSGILVMIGLYSINLRIMGKANVPLFSQSTIFSNDISPVIIIALFAILAKIVLDLFLNTKLGFILRATGDNSQMVTSLGIDIGTIKILGLMLSNGLVAVSGSMMAQYQRFSDVGMGTGIIVMGLASVILGEAIFKKTSWMLPTTTAILGSILYKGSISLALNLGLPPTDLKLITCIIVIFALSLNGRKVNLSFKMLKKFKSGGVPIASDK
ncbi:ABC transporter permease [Clostridium sp. CF011]|uniref:ABC transporter permease n=1 Tax=Clostridium TaxID=1485 RepID=UPI0013EE4FCB|nr:MULTISPECIES: ABC transporter permease [Clostridium]MBU3092651.1 ABC transporter permease [Clostridium sp. CF011]MBW9145307.1 ABC transporter permease [Clostridium sp. CM027]MBZ9606948.1 ABC transporter permease [Clostridium estertheticum]UVE42447.1 ABC transporter permease [Clostridium sp. CM027]WAG71466.1 ABC transporter permease [Clostridium sp. CF011]